MTTPQAARLRLATLMQQVDDAENAERKAVAAVEAAKAAQEATSVAVSYVYSAVAGATPVPASVPIVSSTPMPNLASEREEEDQPSAPTTQQMAQPAEQARATQPTQPVPVFDPRWDKRAKVMAIMGGLVLLMITMMSRDWFANLADVEGTADWLFRFGWVGFGSAAGFFAGGWYGASSSNRARYFEEAS